MIKIRTLDDLPLPARVFYRVDYNVPLDGTRVSDATRIKETLPTLRRLREDGCSVVIASHLGRPKGQRNPKYSLKPVRATRDALKAAGIPVDLIEIPNHDHWYYDQAAKFNQTAWEFLKKYELQADPQYQKYKWDQ